MQGFMNERNKRELLALTSRSRGHEFEPRQVHSKLHYLQVKRRQKKKAGIASSLFDTNAAAVAHLLEQAALSCTFVRSETKV